MADRISDILLCGTRSCIFMEIKKIQQKAVMATEEKREVIAHDVVRIRGATGEENPPIIVSIPRPILNVVKMEKGDEARIYTDGRRIYLEKLEEPTI
jgi:hypothetical protein